MTSLEHGGAREDAGEVPTEAREMGEESLWSLIKF